MLEELVDELVDELTARPRVADKTHELPSQVAPALQVVLPPPPGRAETTLEPKMHKRAAETIDLGLSIIIAVIIDWIERVAD